MGTETAHIVHRLEHVKNSRGSEKHHKSYSRRLGHCLNHHWLIRTITLLTIRPSRLSAVLLCIVTLGWQAIYILLYNNPSYSHILIGSRLWTIRGQAHDWCHHYRVFPPCFKIAESFENLDNIFRDWAKDKVQKSLAEALNRIEKQEEEI